MKTALRQFFRNSFHLGSGDSLARLCSIAAVVLLGHKYGVVVLGAYALAQGVAKYSQPVIDFGLRHVGARLVAVYPQAAGEIVHRVQRRRMASGLVVLPFLLIYAASTKLPLEMKAFVFLFSVTSALYAISVDWAAWGKEQLHLLGLTKAIVPFSMVIFLVVGTLTGGFILWWAVAGNLVGYVLQSAFSWMWWRRHQRRETTGERQLVEVNEALAFRRTSIVGLAWLCNVAFVTTDVLLLGLLSSPEQVGLYSAAYSVVNQVLATYYVVLQVLYPRFARYSVEDRLQMLKPRVLVPLALAGTAIAAVILGSRRMVLTVLFGHHFLTAAPLLLLLAFAVPLDFLTSFLSNAYIAWGMQTRILWCTAIAAGSNIVLNLLWIPVYGAAAAAVNTLLSYSIFLVSLFLLGRSAKELARSPRAVPELAG